MSYSILRKMAMVLFAGSALITGPVLASTASNTEIENTVTVNFDDAAGVAQTAVEASVTITVNLVPTVPIVDVNPTTIDPSTENTSENINYTVTAAANGPDTYNLTPGDSRTNMDADATFGGATSVTLGATTVASAVSASDTVITVPFDAAADGSVNGLAAGDTVVLDPGGANEEVALIDSVDESTGATSNTVTITLDTGVANAHAVGTLIGQRDTVTITATTSTITSGANGTHVVTTNFASADDASVNFDAASTTIEVRRPDLAVTKLVRNVTTGDAGAGTTETVNGNTYYADDVNGNPGDVLEYLVIVDNTDADAGEATNIVITDSVPQFVSYEAGSMALDAATTTATGSGSFTALTDAADGDAGELAGGTVTIYAGAGGVDSGDAGGANGGTLQQGEFSFAIFRVSIDN